MTKLVALLYLMTSLKIIICSDEAAFSNTDEKLQKIELNQNGYIQFLAYRLEVPQITQYTFCVWVKSYNLTHVHPLISTSQNGHDQNLYVYISNNGRYLITKILSQELLKVPIHIQENQWNNICQSWSSRTGWWQVYINGKLHEQGVNELLRQVQIPRSKDLIVGQEMANIDVGLAGGIHGELFGFNMVLTSTTEVPNSNDYQLQSTNIRESIIFPNNNRDEQKFVEYMNALRQQQQEFEKRRNEFQHNLEMFPKPTGIPNIYDNKVNAINNEEGDLADIDFDDYDSDSEDDEELVDIDYPSQLLTPPSHSRVDDSFLTNTNVRYDIHVQKSSHSPGIALYQTPPTLPKYFSENPKASYELKYVKEHYKGNPKNEKFANDVLNYLKSNRNKKNRGRKNRPNTKRIYYRTNKRNGPYSRASEQREVIVDSPSEIVEMNIKSLNGINPKGIQKRNINVEIINPETIIDEYSRRQSNVNEENVYFLNGDYEDFIHEDLPSADLINDKHDSSKYNKKPKYPYILSRHKGITSHLDDVNQNNEDKEESFESVYSRLHYTGPKHIKKERKLSKTNEIKHSPKSSLSYNDNNRLRYYPTPRAFGVERGTTKTNFIVYEDVVKPLKDNEDGQINIGVLHKPIKHGNILTEKYNYHQDRNPGGNFNGNSKNILGNEKYTIPDISVYSPSTSQSIIHRQLPISSGRKLIELSYRKCLMEQGSPMAYDQTSLITWNYTPVTLYGGAIILHANPECGNF